MLLTGFVLKKQIATIVKTAIKIMPVTLMLSGFIFFHDLTGPRSPRAAMLLDVLFTLM